MSWHHAPTPDPQPDAVDSLGDALDEQNDGKSPSAKKKQTEGGGVDTRKRMFEAAKMMQQGLEYM